MLPATLKEVAERLRKQVGSLSNMNSQERKALIQLALLDSGAGVNPDDDETIRRIDELLPSEDATIRPVLPRVKELTGLKDGAIAELVGKARPTVQAYMKHRLKENIDDNARETLARVVEARHAEINESISSLLRDLRSRKD